MTKSKDQYALAAVTGLVLYSIEVNDRASRKLTNFENGLNWLKLYVLVLLYYFISESPEMFVDFLQIFIKCQ